MVGERAVTCQQRHALRRGGRRERVEDPVATVVRPPGTGPMSRANAAPRNRCGITRGTRELATTSTGTGAGALRIGRCSPTSAGAPGRLRARAHRFGEVSTCGRSDLRAAREARRPGGVHAQHRRTPPTDRRPARTAANSPAPP